MKLVIEVMAVVAATFALAVACLCTAWVFSLVVFWLTSNIDISIGFGASLGLITFALCVAVVGSYLAGKENAR